MYTIIIYIPISHLETVKQAMFSVGAGQIGSYHECCWQVKGIGQFKPLQGNNAFVGETDKLSTVDEYRVEMVCKKEIINSVITALVSAHPYETPAYHYFEIKS